MQDAGRRRVEIMAIPCPRIPHPLFPNLDSAVRPSLEYEAQSRERA